MVRVPLGPLAISNFLRQHDLVQVLWVTLSSGKLRNTPARHLVDKQSSDPLQAQPHQSSVVAFDDLMVVVGGGTVDVGVLRQLHAAGGRLVGADGGADQIAAAGLKPELIVGDLDSLKNPASWLGRTRLMQLAEQETTDFEKALYSTRAPLTVALGMTGRRFDHTLAALDAVARYAGKRRIILVDEEDVALALTTKFSFQVAPGERVSIHPLAPVTFWSSDGLEYPLDAVRLAPGVRTGTSNAAIDGPFTIVPEEGIPAPYLLILARSHLMGLVEQCRREARAGLKRKGPPEGGPNSR
jgi:thiamine pyrophosphokinase